MTKGVKMVYKGVQLELGLCENSGAHENKVKIRAEQDTVCFVAETNTVKIQVLF